MRRKTMLSPLFGAIALAALAALGCGGTDPDAPVADPAVPAISALDYTPKEAHVGSGTVIVGTITVEDADGDVAELAIEVTLPGAATAVALPSIPVREAPRGPSGKLGLEASFIPPVAGDYVFAVRVLDAKGHASNRLTAVVRAR